MDLKVVESFPLPQANTASDVYPRVYDARVEVLIDFAHVSDPSPNPRAHIEKMKRSEAHYVIAYMYEQTKNGPPAIPRIVAISEDAFRSLAASRQAAR